MTVRALFAAVAATFALVGCHADTKPSSTSPRSPAAPAPVKEQILGLPEGWEMMPAGAAQFTASQTPGEVIVKATGDLPASNYEAKLFVSPLRIFPPQYLLARHQTGDIGTQALKPFEVTASFKAKGAIPSVIVSDAGGAHKVTVDQARD